MDSTFQQNNTIVNLRVVSFTALQLLSLVTMIPSSHEYFEHNFIQMFTHKL